MIIASSLVPGQARLPISLAAGLIIIVLLVRSRSGTIADSRLLGLGSMGVLLVLMILNSDPLTSFANIAVIMILAVATCWSAVAYFRREKG